MDWQLDWRRVATGSVVLLLHLLLILALLTTTGIVPLRVGVEHEILLTLPAPLRAKERQAVPLPPVPEHVPIPELSFPTFQPQAITVQPPPPQTKSTPEGDIGALGRYLFNCSGQNFEAMSQQDRSHCLANKWDKGRQEKAPVLGEAKPSEFDQVIKERNAPFVPAFQGCDPSSINASLHNVPCTNFSGGHDLLETVPGH